MSDTNSPAPAAPAASESTSNEGQEVQAEGGGEEQQTTAAPKKKPPQYRKIKVSDGEEIALSDEDIARQYSKWRGADKAFREAAEMRKSTEAFLKALQEDPESILSDPRLPLDRKKLAEKWLVSQIEAELSPKDPRDAKLSEYERKVKEYEERDRKAAEEKQQSEYQQVLETRKAAIGQTLARAMEQTHLSANPETAAATLREMALYMRAAKERGVDVTPDELVEHIHNSRFQQYYALANTFEGEELLEFLGEDVVRKIRKADLDRLKASRSQGQQSHKDESWTPTRREKDTGTRMDAHAAKERVRKMLLGG